MKSLKIIQILFKIARIVALIIFVLSIIGAAGCFIGLIVMPAIKDVVVYEGRSIADLMWEKGVDVYAVISSIALGLVSCGVSIFLSKYSEIFFLKELKAGTPFTKEMVKEMRVYGLVFAVTSGASTIAIASSFAIIHIFIPSVGRYDGSFSVGSIIFGIFFIVLSLFCDYGAEKDEELKKISSNEVNKE